MSEVGSYVLHVYCDNPGGCSQIPPNHFLEVSGRSLTDAREKAKKRGWLLTTRKGVTPRKDGAAWLCPKDRYPNAGGEDE